MPLRYLDGPQQYKLYQWITVPIEKSTRDPRPESFKIDPERLECGDVVDTDKGTWRRRTEVVFRDPSWHFDNMEALKQAQRATGRSIGMVKPGRIDDVRLVAKPKAEHAAFREKSRDLKALKEADMFDPEYKKLAYLPNEIRLLWRCIEACSTCRRAPHAMNILDWGVLELARREGWDKAIARMQAIADLSKKDFRLFLGTFRLHPQNFGIIGLWYPPLTPAPDQLELL
ncbi:MAG TPA: hypothetical protein VHB25_08650 [Gemmatimonadaceae bacterium]|nr:hypothetical protein [Gemmatimonadaceae bacterium]